jgi:hypothetical protein
MYIYIYMHVSHVWVMSLHTWPLRCRDGSDSISVKIGHRVSKETHLTGLLCQQRPILQVSYVKRDLLSYTSLTSKETHLAGLLRQKRPIVQVSYVKRDPSYRSLMSKETYYLIRHLRQKRSAQGGLYSSNVTNKINTRKSYGAPILLWRYCKVESTLMMMMMMI